MLKILRPTLLVVSFAIYSFLYSLNIDDYKFGYVTIGYLIICIIIFKFRNTKKLSISPIDIFLFYYSFIIILGILNAQYLFSIGHNSYYLNVHLNDAAYYSSLFCTIVTFLGLILLNNNRLEEVKIYDINYRKFKVVSALLLSIGIITTLALFAQDLTFPIFNNDPMSRFDFFENLKFSNYSLVGSLSISLIFYFILYKENIIKKISFYLIFSIILSILLLFASRAIVLLPIIVVISTQHFMYKRIRFYSLFLLAITLMFFVGYFVSARGETGVAMDSIFTEFYKLAPEFIDFSLVTYYVPNTIPYNQFDSIRVGLLTYLPSEVWQVFGVNKMKLYTELGNSLSLFLGRPTGTRITIVGEAYWAFGIYGVIIYAIIFGLILIIATKNIYNNRRFSRRILSLLTFSLFIFIIPFDLGAGLFPRILIYILFPMFVLKLIRVKNV